VETVDGEQIKLGLWANNRRADYRKGRLRADRAATLEALPGWEWDPVEAEYQRGLAALRRYTDRVGDARVTRSHVETVDGEQIKLGAWVSSRRAEHRKDKLRPERVAALEALPGWAW
jgi:hypothetical protein